MRRVERNGSAFTMVTPSKHQASAALVLRNDRRGLRALSPSKGWDLPATLISLLARYGSLLIFTAALLENAGVPSPAHTAMLAGDALGQQALCRCRWWLPRVCSLGFSVTTWGIWSVCAEGARCWSDTVLASSWSRRQSKSPSASWRSLGAGRPGRV